MFDLTKLNVSMVEQGTDEWKIEKMGYQSASNAELYLVEGKNSDKMGAGLLKYLEELADMCAQKVPTFDNWSTAATSWGIETEPMARKQYSLRNMVGVKEYGFISSKKYRYGFSPDGGVLGLKDGVREGLEIKCFDTKNHIPIFLSNEPPKKVNAQCQFSMMVSGFDAWNAVFYDPRLVDHLQYRHFRIERDELMIDMMRKKAIIGSQIIDDRLKLLGLDND
jgi:hypothetical protein